MQALVVFDIDWCMMGLQDVNYTSSVHNSRFLCVTKYYVIKLFVRGMKVNICKITVKIASFDKVKLCVLTEHFRENVFIICKKTDILVYF